MKPNSVITLNEEQQEAVNARDGIFVVLAGPGSGKSTVLVKRYLEMLAGGVPFNEMLNLTFTHGAAQEMASRSGILDAKSVFRTFHSFALEMLKNERDKLPFETCETIVPFELQDYTLMFELVDIYNKTINWRTLQEKISAWKCNGIHPDQAIEQSRHLGIEYFYALAYRDYEIKCREQGWLDFGSMMDEAVKLLETNEEVRNKYKKKYISVDEAQDCDTCHPPGTLIRKIIGRKKGPRTWGWNKIITKDVPIETLRNGDKVACWAREYAKIVYSGGPISISKRRFEGDLIEIICGKKKVRVTPDHKMYVNMNGIGEEKRLVYLMYRKKVGFRVGECAFRYKRSRKFGRTSMNGLGVRFNEERADYGWVLKVAKNKQESETLEQIISCNYGIPYATYGTRTYINPYRKRTAAMSREIFKKTNGRGIDCLKDFGLSFKYPLFVRSEYPNKRKTVSKRYFETAAINLIPKIMSIPSTEECKKVRIDRLERIPYKGPVYSLNVPRWHTYVANGLVVKNCQFKILQLLFGGHLFVVGDENQLIYNWRGAQTGNLSNFARVFPGAKVLYLGTNHRSSLKLVNFLKDILPVDNGLASRMTTYNPLGDDFTITLYGDEEEEANEVLRNIKDPQNTSILARTNRQLFVFQRLCAMRNIKYNFLGKKDYWDQNEVKKLLNYAKNIRDNRPANVVLTDLISQHNMINTYSRIGRDNPMDASPIENLNSIVKIAKGKGNIKEFLDYLRKLTHARKSSKALTLSTIHQAKGMEWDTVYLVGADQGTMPHRDGEGAEEARIFFVGCSRAAKELHISFYKSLSMYLNNYKDRVVEFQKEKSVALPLY